MKCFIITVDTEGDNLWKWEEGSPVLTKNSAFLPRFQELCEKYNFKPVYLTNYEMLNNVEWVQYSKMKAADGKCEIGLHLHAWNTPPFIDIENRYGGNPYITEYSREQIEAKVDTMIDLFKNVYGYVPVSHRSGRWATNDTYFNILAKKGIKVDCSMTPGLDLSNIPGRSLMCGNNYKRIKHKIFELPCHIIEVPMSTMHTHMITGCSIKNILRCIIKGNDFWLRPIESTNNGLVDFFNQVSKKSNYIEFMVHSSELMPGGSPYFTTELDIEEMYSRIEDLFKIVKEQDYIGYTLKEIGELYELNKNHNQ